MLTLLYGTRGAREEIYNRIAKDVESKNRAFLIVPDQKALLAENALASRLDKSSALLVDAVGFSRLSNLVCRKYGSLTYNYASEGAKVLTMYRTIKALSPVLKIFGGEIQSGTLSSLCSLMGEFRAAAIASEEIANAAENIKNKPLSDKLFDLALIYTEYEALLHEQFAEQADDIDTLCKLLADNDFFGDASVYVDSFISFTKQELNAIHNMLLHKNKVFVALPFDSGIHTEECRDTRKKLIKVAQRANSEFDEIFTISHAPEALEFAKDNLWNFGGSPSFEESTEGVLEICRCDTKGQEVSLCLREIYKALESGHSYSDIAIIARNAESYGGELDRALKKCSIPFFFSLKKSAEYMPLTRFILCALSLYVYNFTVADVAAYIKTGLSGITDEECDIFEEYIDRWNISGRARYLDGEDFTMSKEGYTVSAVDMDSLTDINSIKKRFAAPISRFCDTLDGAKTVKDFCCAVYELLTELDTKEKAKDNDFTKYFGTDKRADAIRLWNTTMDALDTMVDAAGSETVSAYDFCSLVRLLFSAIDIAEIPSSKDQIIIGNADTIRIDERKIIIILGANSGVFPAPVKESVTLCESERLDLEAAGVSLSQNLQLRSARELFHFVRAIDFATEKVVISYYKKAGANTNEASPSFAITRLGAIFKKLKTYDFSELSPAEQLCFSADAENKIGCYDRTTEALLKAVLSPLGKYKEPISDPLDLGNTAASISSEVAKSYYTDSMTLSQSKIDTYVGCHLKHFLEHVLHLSGTKPFEFGANVRGTFIHSVLEILIDYLKKENKKLPELTIEEAQKIAAEITASQMEKIMNSSNIGDSRMLCYFERMNRSIMLIIQNLANEFANSSFEPFLTEYKFGYEGHTPLAVELSDGSKVSLNGTADRIDIYKEDGTVYVRIADYKTGDKPFSEKDIEEGKNLQLLIYLFSLCKVCDKSFLDLCGVESNQQIKAAGATYFIVKPPRIAVGDLHDESTIEKASDTLSRKGFVFNLDTLGEKIDRSLNHAFTKGLIKKDENGEAELFDTVCQSIARVAENMRDGKIDALETDTGDDTCVFCDYKYICRYDKNINTEESDNA